MKNNIKAVQYICSKYPSLECQSESELTGNQKILKKVTEFFEGVSREEATLEQQLDLAKTIESLSDEELKVAIKASLIYEGHIEYPTEIKNHSVIDGQNENYSSN